MFRGTVIAQVIAIIGSVFVAKLYGEEAFGYLSLFLSIGSILAIVYTLQLDKRIIISKSRKESQNWFNFLFPLVIVISVLALFIMISFYGFFLSNHLEKQIAIFSCFVAIILALNTVHESLFTFTKKFKLLSNSKIFFTLNNLILQLIFYHFFEKTGLILAFFISTLLLSIFYAFRNQRNFTKINFTEIKKGLKENNTIVTYLLPSNIINTVANHVMPILLLSFFGLEEAGIYFFSMKILGAPLHLISSSVSQVYFQKSAELREKHSQQLFKLTKKVVLINTGIMLAIILIVNSIGIYLLELYFENQWRNLRLYLLILSFLIVARSSFNPISSLIVVLDKNREGLLFNVYLLSVNIVAIYFGNAANDIFHSLIILSVFGGLGYLILLFYFLKSLKKTNVY
jgi:O-antigen/teichoic acid export membrane protein